MSATIDERVVEMRFDNKQFEQGIQTSLTSLDRLKKGLDLDGAAKGLEDLGAAAKKCDMSVLSSSVETVQAKFSALQVMAITALSNITNSAINAGKRIASSLTIDPVKTGFNEYELKMGSIQTIMASTGESLDRVNQKLNELNEYSDRTIYSFSDMTQNIGKFTNAGIKLDDAVTAIQGVANVAAISGANANEASRAMYNFGQALSSGYVKLIDWKSIENANMATVEFKEQLIETALEMGTVVKVGDKYKSTTTDLNGKVSEAFTTTTMFNDSLSAQWMTSEVLTKTLAKYTDETTDLGKKAVEAAQDVKTFTQLLDTLKESAQSGWAETWQLIVGDFEEAKGTLREFSEFFSGIIDGSAEARNALLGGAMQSSWGQLKDQVAAAGFSVDEFRDTLRETATESVSGLDKMIEEAGSFDATLSEGWLTTDILAKTLDNLANKTTGTTDGISALSDEQLKNVGYTKEQIKALRALSDEAKNSSGNVKHLVDTMTRASGRELLFGSLLNGAKAVQKLFGALKGAWNDVFPPATSEQIYSIIVAINKFTERLANADDTFSKIGRTFKGLFAVLDIVRQAFVAVFNAIKPLFGGVETLGGGILEVTASFGDWLVNLDKAIEEGNYFKDVCQNIADFIGLVVEKIKAFAKAVREKFSVPGLDLIQKRFEQIGKSAEDMGSGVIGTIKAMGKAFAESKFLQALKLLWEGVKTVGGAIIDGVSTIVGSIVKSIGSAEFSGAIDLLNGISFAGIAVAIKKFVGGIETSLGSFEKVGSKVTGILDSVRGCFDAYQKQLNAGTLMKIASAIGILTVAVVALSLVDSAKLNVAIGAITMLFADLMGAMAIFDKVSGNAKGVMKSCAAMISMSTAVLILASALKKLASLDMDKLAVGLTGVVGLTATLVAATKFLTAGGNEAVKGATQMILFATAIKILSSVCEDLSGLNWNELSKGLVGVGVLLAEVALFMNTAKFSGKSITTATGIVILASAMKILASACSDFAQMKWEEIGKGLTSIGALLLEVAAFTKLTGNAKHVISTGLALIEISAAMKIFASAMSDFAQLDWDDISRGLVAMGGALAEVAIATNLMPKNMVSMGVGLIAVGGALEIMADALGKMGDFSWEEIGKGLTAMGGALAELAIALNLMKGTLAGSAAMLVASSALLVMVPVLSALGAMSWESIVKGLVSLAGAFTIIGVAGAVLTPLIGTILGLGAAFTLIGLGVTGIGAGLALAGAGLSAVAVGITALSLSLAGGVTAIVAGLTAIITGIAALIPAIVRELGNAIIVFCNVIAEGAPAIAEAVKAVVLSLVDVLVECVPAIAEGVLELVAGVLAALVEYTPQIVDSIFQFLIGVLEGVARNLPGLIQAVVDVFMSFFAGIVDALAGIDTEVLLKGIVGIGLLAAIMAALAAVAGLAPGAMVGVLAMGAVIAELALVLAAVGALAQVPGLNWLINEGGKLLQDIGTAIGGFVGGIVGGFMSGVSSQFPQIGTDLSAFMTNVQPFVDGAAAIKPEMIDGVKALTEVVLLLTAADILEGLTSWFTGGSSLSGFAEELVPFGAAMLEFSNTIQGLDGELVNKAAIAGKTLAEMAATLPNSGGVVGFFAGENDMGAFGEQLEGFGNAIMKFADTVTGLDAETVTNAATAGKAMAEMAATIPNSGGVVSFFTGENNMADFGEQLVPFGEAIKAYSVAVQGLDVNAVTNSATAGKTMVELANTLPNTGGAVAFFTGDNDLATFGNQLLSFGFAMKAYSLAVSGLDVNAVTNSAMAGQALVELANTIPNCGGLVSLFTGDNNIADFGDDIVEFGKDLAAYSDAIVNVKADAVTASANAASALSNLAANLPDSSLFDKWFGGDQTLSDFGDDIASFGEDMGYYYSQISVADPARLSAVIDQVWRLVDLAEGTSSLDVSGFSSFSGSLNALAQAGLTGFTTAFQNSSQSITTSINTMLGFVVTAIGNGQPSTTASVQALVLAWAGTVTSNTPSMTSSVALLMMGVNTTIRTNGELIKGTVSLILTQAISLINSRRPSFVQAGQNVSQGFADGIRSNIVVAANAAAALANATVKAAKQRLEINSPSKVFNMLGMYVDIGLANGIRDNVGQASNAAANVGGAIVTAFKKKLEIKSPSRVLRDEVGNYIVEGIAEGITEDMSAEEAAAKKAQNIVEAFQKELDKADLDFSEFDMDYKLWEAGEGRNASDSAKAAKKQALLDNKIIVQSSVVDLKKGEYDNMVKQFGEESSEARESKLRLDQAVLDLLELQNEKDDLTTEVLLDEQDNFKKRLEAAEKLLESRHDSWVEENPVATETDKAAKEVEYLSGRLSLQGERVALAQKDMEDAIAKYGQFSLEALEAEAEYNDAVKERTSLQNEINAVKKNEEYRNRQAVQEYYDILQENWDWMKNAGYSDQEIWDYAERKSGYVSDSQKILEEAEQSASDVAKILSEIPTKTAEQTATAITQTLSTTSTQAVQDSGVRYAESFGTGVQNGAPDAAEVGATALVTATANKMTEQSAEWSNAGNVLVDAFITSIQSNVERAAHEAAEMAKAAYSAAMNAVSVTSSGAAASVSYSAGGSGSGSVTPVVSMDDPKTVLELGKGPIAITSTEAATQIATARTAKGVPVSEKIGDDDKPGTTVNFTQNNYSPKALSRTDIYRDTKNGLSVIKGKVVT